MIVLWVRAGAYLGAAYVKKAIAALDTRAMSTAAAVLCSAGNEISYLLKGTDGRLAFDEIKGDHGSCLSVIWIGHSFDGLVHSWLGDKKGRP